MKDVKYIGGAGDPCIVRYNGVEYVFKLNATKKVPGTLAAQLVDTGCFIYPVRTVSTKTATVSQEVKE